MNIMMNFKILIIAFLIFIITDAIWLSLIAKSLYFKYYAPWLNIIDGQLKPLWWAALLVYLLFALSILVFIIPLSHGLPYQAALYGAILGAIIYGVYDFTCLAIFKNFPIGIGLLDWFWGTILCSWGAFLTVFIKQYLR